MNITAAIIQSWRPGPRLRRRIQALISSGTVTQAQLAALDLSPRDKLMLLSYCVTARKRRLAGALLADRACNQAGMADAGVLAVTDVVRAHVNDTATDGELATARATALAAIATATSEPLAAAARAVAASALPITPPVLDPGLTGAELRARQVGRALRRWKAPVRAMLRAADHTVEAVAWASIWQPAWQAPWEAARETTPPEELLPPAQLSALQSARDAEWTLIVNAARGRVTDDYQSQLALDPSTLQE